MNVFSILIKNNRNDLVCLILIISVGIIFFKDIIFGTRIVPWDLVLAHYPFMYQMVLSVENFEFPLWSIANFGGMPWHAYFETGSFYPPNYVIVGYSFLVNDFSFSYVEIAAISHIILFGILTYFLTSRSGLSTSSSLVASFVVMLAAWTPSNLHHLGMIATVSYLPLIILLLRRSLLEKKSWLPLIIPISLSLLAGYPPAFFVVLFVAFFYVIGLSFIRNRKVRFKLKNILKFLLVCLVCLLVTAVFIMPALEFLINSDYKFKQPVHSRGASSFPTLITILTPGLFGLTNDFNPHEVDYWHGDLRLEDSYRYLGILPIILFFIGIRYNLSKENYVLLSIGVFSFLASFSYLTPIPDFFHSIELGILFRQIVWFGPAQLVFAIFAAYGLDTLRKSPNFSQKKIVLISVIITIMIFFMITILYYFELFPISDLGSIFLKDYTAIVDLSETQIDKIVNNEFWNLLTLLFLLSVSCVIIWLIIKTKYSKLIVVVVLLFILFDLSYFGMNGDFYSIDSKYATDSEIGFSNRTFEKDFLTFFKEDNSKFRIDANSHRTDWGNRGALAIVQEIETVRGGYANQPSNFIAFLKANDVFLKYKEFYNEEINLNSKFYDYFNVKYLVTSRPIENISNDVNLEKWSQVKSLNNWKIYQNDEVMDRAFFVKKMVLKDSDNDIATILHDSNFDPNNILVVNSHEISPELIEILKQKNLLTNFPYDDGFYTDSEIKLHEYNFNSVKIRAATNQDGYLILADLYYPGWKAKIDGKEIEVFEANLALRGIYLPKGEHNVEFYYEPFTLQLGIIISVTTLIGIILFSLKNRLKLIPSSKK